MSSPLMFRRAICCFDVQNFISPICEDDTDQFAVSNVDRASSRCCFLDIGRVKETMRKRRDVDLALAQHLLAFLVVEMDASFQCELCTYIIRQRQDVTARGA